MKSLMKYRTSYNDKSSWGLMPIGETPVVSGIYNPTDKILALIMKDKKESFSMVPRLDDTGAPQLVSKGLAMKQENFKQERVRLEKYYEHYLADPRDISWFLSTFAENNFVFKEEEEELVEQ